MSRVQPMSGGDNMPDRRARRRPPDDDPTHREVSVAEEPQLASMLATPDNTDPSGGHDDGGLPWSALTAPPPVDPDVDFVPSGLRIPRYVAAAIRAKAVLTHRSQQAVVVDALLGRDPLPPQLLARCRNDATGGRPS